MLQVVEANGLVWMRDDPLAPTDLLESGADEVRALGSYI